MADSSQRDLIRRTNMLRRTTETWRPPLFVQSGGRWTSATAALRRFPDVQAGSIWRDDREVSVTAAWADPALRPLCGSADQSNVVAESNIDLAKLDKFAFASRKRPEYMHPRLIECPSCRLLYGSPVLSPEMLAGRCFIATPLSTATKKRSLIRAIACAKSEDRALITWILNGTRWISARRRRFLEQLSIRPGFQNGNRLNHRMRHEARPSN